MEPVARTRSFELGRLAIFPHAPVQFSLKTWLAFVVIVGAMLGANTIPRQASPLNLCILTGHGGSRAASLSAPTSSVSLWMSLVQATNFAVLDEESRADLFKRYGHMHRCPIVRSRAAGLECGLDHEFILLHLHANVAC